MNKCFPLRNSSLTKISLQTYRVKYVAQWEYAREASFKRDIFEWVCIKIYQTKNVILNL